MATYPLTDIHLGRRLERTEGGANRAFVESRAVVEPQVGAMWIEVAGDLAMMGAAPGSASQRNAERHGFRIAYTRTKWELK